MKKLKGPSTLKDQNVCQLHVQYSLNEQNPRKKQTKAATEKGSTFFNPNQPGGETPLAYLANFSVTDPNFMKFAEFS